MPTVLAGVTQDITIAFHASETVPTGLPTSLGFMLVKDDKGAPQFHAKDLARIDLINRVRAAGLEIDEETLRIVFYKDDWSGPFGAYEERAGQNRPAHGTNIDFKLPSPTLAPKKYVVPYKTYTATTISFTSGTKTIADSANGLADFKGDEIGPAALVVGDTIVITGSANNNGTYTIDTGSVAGSIVVIEALVTEGAGASVTITVTNTNTVIDVVDFGSATYAAAGPFIYRITNWTTTREAEYFVTVYKTTYSFDGRVFHKHNGYLYACAGTGGEYVYTTDGTTWTVSNRGGTDQQATEFATLRGILHKRVGQNHYQLSAATSNGINGGEVWSSADQIGDTSYSIGRMLVVQDSLVFATSSGLEQLDGEGNILSLLPDLDKTSGPASGSGAHALAWLNSAVFFPCADGSIWLYQNGEAIPIAPALQLERTLPITSQTSYPIHSRVLRSGVASNRIYIAQGTETTGDRLLELEKLESGRFIWRTFLETAGDFSFHFIPLYVVDSPAGPALFFNGAAGALDYYMLSVGRDPAHDTRSRFNASGVIYDPFLTMGCPEVNKRWSHIEAAVTQSTPANYAKTAYTCDAFNEAGSDVVTTNTFTMAEGITIGTINFNANTISRRARLVHTLSNTGASQELETPILLWERVYAYALPTPQRRFEMLLNISSNDEMATQVQARQFLDTISGAQLPLTLTDPFGNSWTVNPSRMDVEEFISGRDYNDYDEAYRLVLIEQTAGV